MGICLLWGCFIIGVWLDILVSINYFWSLIYMLCKSKQNLFFFLSKCCLPTGLCNSEKRMLELHQMDSCTKSPTVESDE